MFRKLLANETDCMIRAMQANLGHAKEGIRRGHDVAMCRIRLAKHCWNFNSTIGTHMESLISTLILTVGAPTIGAFV